MSTLRRIAAMGFEGVELSSRWLNLFEMGRQELADLKHEVREAGIAVSGINMNRFCWFGHRAKSNLDRLSAAIDIAAALGAPLVNSLSRRRCKVSLRGPYFGEPISPARSSNTPFSRSERWLITRFFLY